MSEAIRSIIEALKQEQNMSFLPGASISEIKVFEIKNNLKLPEKLKEWLTFSDGGELYLPAGVQFYGVAHKPLIDADDDDRPNKDYIVIGALATGDPILFEKGKNQISIFNHDAGKIEEDEIYDDLSSFLNDLPATLGLEV